MIITSRLPLPLARMSPGVQEQEPSPPSDTFRYAGTGALFMGPPAALGAALGGPGILLGAVEAGALSAYAAHRSGSEEVAKLAGIGAVMGMGAAVSGALFGWPGAAVVTALGAGFGAWVAARS